MHWAIIGATGLVGTIIPRVIVYTFFDLTPDSCDNVSHISPRRNGTVSASIHFARPLPATVTLVTYAEFTSVLTVYQYRNVVCDYAT